MAAAEENLCDGLIASRGEPCRAEITATDVHGDRHIGRLCLKGTVDHGDIGALDAVEVETACLVCRTFLRIAELAPGRIVELEIATAFLIECTDGLLVCADDVLKERILVLVAWDRCVVRCAHAADEVQHARRGDCHLGKGIPCDVMQKAKVREEWMHTEVDLVCDSYGCRLWLCALEGDGPMRCADLLNAV